MSDRDPYQNSMDDDYRQSPYRSAYYAQKTSGLAILSVLSGLASFPMMCLCFVSIPFSVFAIVAGHMSRGIVRDTNGQHSGMEMATFGLILGYCSLFIMTGFLLFSLVAGEHRSTSVTTVIQGSTEGTVLLEQAKAQLLGGVGEATFGVSTTDSDADAMSRHYVDTLHVLDATHFTETNASEHIPKRDYRAFVQLNKNSVAFLLLVPDYKRFTDSALEVLHERCWLIAQRTVDNVLPENVDLAVAIYSGEGVRKVMVGKTQRSGPAKSGLRNADVSESVLKDFFLLAKNFSGKKTPDKPAVDSKIDAKDPGEVQLPAEAD